MFKRVLTLLIVFTMYFNAGMVPNFLLVKILNVQFDVGARFAGSGIDLELDRDENGVCLRAGQPGGIGEIGWCK